MWGVIKLIRFVFFCGGQVVWMDFVMEQVDERFLINGSVSRDGYGLFSIVGLKNGMYVEVI